MTPNQITTLIASGLERELDMPFRLQLMDRVKYWRSRLIANSLQKKPNQRKFFRQTLYLSMQTELEVPQAALISGKVASTVEEVPLLIRVGTSLFDYVGGPDGRSPFREVDPGTGNYLAEGKFSHLFPTYEYLNRRIRTIKSNQPLIRVDGIFHDPQAAEELNCSCTGGTCDTWNAEFPISGDLLQLVVQSILYVDYNRRDAKDTPEIELNQTTA